MFLHEKLKNIETYDPNKSVLGKWMSLLISYNKKDVSIHQALWHLQGFDFMHFSDKFQTINIKDILNLQPSESYDHDNDPENETVENKVNLDNINTVSDVNNKVQSAEIDLNVFKSNN